ncbi:hypothetical protein HYPSUDRAFT_140328, partial [Hypholoma sublateritium FD-334 SS-4]
VPPESGLYRGPVLFNPGGPGSGVDFIRSARGEQFSSILGPQFDILSFDPRGVARSTPRVSFFESDVERELWMSETIAANMSDVPRVWARAHVLSQLAGEADTGYLRHVNTDNTARDMLRIFEAHGRSKIQYWGFSYGTILGATFAAMFPDKVERMVLDGVSDSEDYYASRWASGLMDTDKAMESFYTGCAAAGPDGCAFWAPTTEEIRQNASALSDFVRISPIPTRTSLRYGLFDINKLDAALFTSLYFPYSSFPALAQGLSEVAAGTPKILFDRENLPLYKCACDAPECAYASVVDVAAAFFCNDGVDTPGDLQSTEEYFSLMKKLSPEWGINWAHIRMKCVGWPKFPKNHFRGPFIANTSHPILLIGNTADPVSPLWVANKMSKGFKDSVVLTQDSVGHGSVSAPSLCTQKYVRGYFIDGTLPGSGTVCLTVSQPFPLAGISIEGSGNQALFSEDLTSDEVGILEAILNLSKDPGVVLF